MTDEQKPNEPGTMLTHLPLPYLVRLRLTVGDDAVPTAHELKVTAYSVMEAVMQASMEMGAAGIGDEKVKVKVEHVAPDVPAYDRIFRTFLAAVQSAAKALR